MKILVFSDSHGNIRGMEAAMRLHPDVECVFFLGDGLWDIDMIKAKYKSVFFLAVRGNCDFTHPHIEDEETIAFEGKRFLLMHGHHRGVKESTTRAIEYARARGADVLLYGHTHVPDNRYLSDGERPIYVFNPGSISRPRENKPTYGVIDVLPGGIVLSHGEVV